MSDDASRLRLDLARRVAALVDAIRAIPPELAPAQRAVTQAVREQIYHGYEVPLARAEGGARFWGKYEEDRPWSVAAARAVLAEPPPARGRRLLNRDHVHPVSLVVRELLQHPRGAAETADLLDARLVTCTVLAGEHARLTRLPADLVGWERYEAAGIAVQPSLGRSGGG